MRTTHVLQISGAPVVRTDFASNPAHALRTETMEDTMGIYIAAADIGATHVRSAVFDGDGRCITHRKEPLWRDGADGRAVTGQVIRMLRAVCNAAGTVPDAVGIATAGPLSADGGSIFRSPNMPYADIPLRGPLEAAFPCPVAILNDAAAGAYHEYHAGAGRGCRNLVYLTISTGIGCGVVADGRLIGGAGGNAGEAGHFCVDTVYHLPCGCGGAGHWEAYASGAGMPRFYRAWCKRRGQELSAALEHDVTAESLCAAARAGDAVAVAFFRDLAVVNGRGFSSLIAAYAPERIVVGGPVATENPDLVVAPAREYIDRYLPMPEIVLSGADGMAPLVGAAVFAGESLKNDSTGAFT